MNKPQTYAKFVVAFRRLPKLAIIILVLLLIILSFKGYGYIRNRVGERSLAKEATRVALPGKPISTQYYAECHGTSAAFAPGPTVCVKEYQAIYASGASICDDYTKVNSAILAAGYILSTSSSNYIEYTKTDPSFIKEYGLNPTDCQVLDSMSHQYVDITYHLGNTYPTLGKSPNIFVTCKYGSSNNKYDLDKLWPSYNAVKVDRATVYGCVWQE